MDKKVSMSRSERLRREKVTRYSIRKYSFGAASVAVAALFMFLGNGAVSANENGTDSQGGAAVAASPNGGGMLPQEMEQRLLVQKMEKQQLGVRPLQLPLISLQW